MENDFLLFGLDRGGIDKDCAIYRCGVDECQLFQLRLSNVR